MSVLFAILILSRMYFRFQPKIFNGCHDMTQKYMSFDDAVIVAVRGNHYRIKFWFMTKIEAKNK